MQITQLNQSEITIDASKLPPNLQQFFTVEENKIVFQQLCKVLSEQVYPQVYQEIYQQVYQEVYVQFATSKNKNTTSMSSWSQRFLQQIFTQLCGAVIFATVYYYLPHYYTVNLPAPVVETSFRQKLNTILTTNLSYGFMGSISEVFMPVCRKVIVKTIEVGVSYIKYW